MKMIAFVFILMSFSVHSSDQNLAMKRQIKNLESRVVTLEHRLKMIELRLSNQSNNVFKAWECYMDDLRAGFIYASGVSKLVAKNKVLEKCRAQKGSCWELKVECESSR